MHENSNNIWLMVSVRYVEHLLRHPIMAEINNAGLSIDKVMVVKFNDTFIIAPIAQHLLTMIGTDKNCLID